MSEQITYKDAGVDIDEGARAVAAIHGSVKSTYRPEVVGDIGGFGGLFSAAKLKDMEDPLLVSGTDGVGTKLQLAKLAGKHDTVGIDLVAMCVNDVLACGAEPLFFLDYVAIGKLRAEHIAEVVGGIAEGCRQAGCALVGGEMAEHPGVMDPDEYDLSGFCVGVVDRPKMLGPARVAEGDVVLGLASTGIHSNGFSLVRRAVTDVMGKDELEKPRDEFDGKSLLEALLAPTRIYVKSILALLKAMPQVHAVAHITGGGITENLNRVLPRDLDARIERGSWPVVPVIDYVVDRAGLAPDEAYKTFNMGIGMCVVVAPEKVEAAKSQLESTGETVYEIGTIVPGSGEVVYADAD
ncbi:MAG: phosphoribosylformylglycinamidine cyclo-ligase [Coriobacteriales bacterium]|jgi:phosphoribosylformylglycinamidine cyclo-ligase